MKKIANLLSLAVLALALPAMAESTITLSGVHNCCGGCSKGITKAITSVSGVTATVEDETVIIKAKTDAAGKKAVEALMEAGYYGTGSEVSPPTVADAQVKTSTVAGVHLCCGKCVKAVDEAVTSVKGVSKHDATKGAKSFTVEGEFSKAELAAALNKHGLHGTLK